MLLPGQHPFRYISRKHPASLINRRISGKILKKEVTTMSNTVVGILGILTIVAIVVTLFKSKTQPTIACMLFAIVLGIMPL